MYYPGGVGVCWSLLHSIILRSQADTALACDSALYFYKEICGLK